MKMILILSVFLLAPSIFGASQTNKPVVPTQDAQELRQNVQELGRMFGAVETPETNQPAVQHKTVGDVMDKAIDKVSDVVGAMSQAISKVAPDVWRIMIKQQYAKAIGRVVPWLGAVFVIWILSRSFKKWYGRVDAATKDKHERHGDAEDITVFEVSCTCYYASLVIVAILSLVFFYQLTAAIQLVINPEYYAIQDLLRMILNKGAP